MLLENVIGPFKDEARAEFLDMPDLADLVDPDKGPEDVPPMPTGGKGFQVTDDKGQSFGVQST